MKILPVPLLGGILVISKRVRAQPACFGGGRGNFSAFDKGQMYKTRNSGGKILSESLAMPFLYDLES